MTGIHTAEIAVWLTENTHVNTNASIKRRPTSHWYAASLLTRPATRGVFMETRAEGKLSRSRRGEVGGDGTYFSSSFLDGQIQRLLLLLESARQKNHDITVQH